MSRRGLYGNALYTAWTAVLGFLVVPLLTRILGIEAYGLVGLLVTTQAVLLALDWGLSAAVNRYVARYLARSGSAQVADLLASLAPVYWTMGVLVLTTGLAISPWVARDWLTVVSLSSQLVTHALALISAIVAIRWVQALYQAALIGAGRVDISSAIGTVGLSIAQVGGVIAAWASADVRYYLACLLLCALLQMMALRRAAWLVLALENRPRRNLASLRPVLRFSLAMAGVSLTGMVLMQSDKLLLSNAVTLDEFALYSLAWTVASGLYVILTPTFNVIAPRLASLVALGESSTLEREYRRNSRLFTSVLFPATAVMIIVGGDILELFAGDAVLGNALHTALSFLVLGTAMNGVMHFPYALQLASGRSDIALAINLANCLVFVPLLFFLVDHFGTTGAAAAWCVINVLYFIGGCLATRRLIAQHPPLIVWWGRDLLPALLCTSVLMGAWYLISAMLRVDGWNQIVITLIAAALTVLCCLRITLRIRVIDLPVLILGSSDEDDRGEELR